MLSGSKHSKYQYSCKECIIQCRANILNTNIVVNSSLYSVKCTENILNTNIVVKSTLYSVKCKQTF